MGKGRSPKVMQAAGTGGTGLRAARAVASEVLDRARPDGFEALREKLHDLDNPTPGGEYKRLIGEGGKFMPAPGRFLVQQRTPYASARDAGLVVPETADVHRGGNAGSEYEVLACGAPCHYVEDPEYHEACSEACREVKPGDVVLASAHTGADVREWGGEDLFVLRCSRIGALVIEETGA